MLPQNVISSPPFPAPYLAKADADETDPTVSYELGGIALNDPSRGREVQIWTARISGQDIKLSSAGNPEITLFSAPGVLTAVSLAFDSNMQPTVSYIEDGVVKLYWFNTIPSQFVMTDYPGATSGRVCTDDKRDSQFEASDVIFAYVRDDILYWRQQRDRYDIERMAGPCDGLQLYRLGMNTLRRLQFELR